MSDDHSHTDTTQRALVFAFIINTVFLVIEVSAALYANSLTLLADALHMFTDSASILLAIAAAYFAQKAADELRTYGYHRLEVLGGFLNGLFLIGTVMYIAYDSYARLQNPSPIESEIVIIIGILGLVANLLAAYMLTDHQHSLNAKGAYLHLLADAGGSIAAIFAGTLIYFTDLHIIDTIFAIIIGIIILYSTKSLLQKTLHILLQGTPAHTTVTEIKQTLEDIDGVVNAHHIHIWALKSDHAAASAHIVVGRDTAKHTTVLETSLSKLQALGLSHSTVQIETKEFNEKEHDCYTETV